MDKQTRLLILKEVIRQSALRHENMKTAIAFGIIDFKTYQTDVAQIVDDEVNKINNLEIRHVR